MKSAIKDADGNNLRPRYRVECLIKDREGEQGTVIGLAQPWSVTVDWDDGEEEVVNARMVRHISKLA